MTVFYDNFEYNAAYWFNGFGWRVYPSGRYLAVPYSCTACEWIIPGTADGLLG